MLTAKVKFWDLLVFPIRCESRGRRGRVGDNPYRICPNLRCTHSATFQAREKKFLTERLYDTLTHSQLICEVTAKSTSLSPMCVPLPEVSNPDRRTFVTNLQLNPLFLSAFIRKCDRCPVPSLLPLVFNLTSPPHPSNPPMSAAAVDSASHRLKRAKTASLPSELTHTTKKRNVDEDNGLSESDELEGDNDSDYHEAAVPPSTSQTKGRPRKSGKISRSTRDSLRRQNHSRIEKARRTKINEALDTLRALVPPSIREDGNDDEEEGAEGRKRGQQKEFKLEILVRTVTYMKQLISRVEELEAKKYHHKASVSQPRGLKRKRDEIFQQLLDEEPVPVPTSRGHGDSASRASTTSPLLPPISTLFQHQSTSLASLPSPDQLPSPPATAEFRPRSDSLEHPYSARLPSLTLPSPRSDRSHPSQDDESAATLLLHMKARSPSFTSPTTNPLIQTPGSALGLS